MARLVVVGVVVAVMVLLPFVVGEEERKAESESENVTTILGDLVVLGSLTTSAIKSSGMKLDGSVMVTETLKVKTVKSSLAVAAVVEAGVIQSPSGKVTVNGDLEIASATQVDSLNVMSALMVGGVSQWRLVQHDDFDSEEPVGWSLLQLGTCDGLDHFLGGHCNFAGHSSEKEFHLPPHKQLRINARYHFIDNWDGETAFLKVDDQVAWTDTHHNEGHPSAFNVCGNDKYPERKLSTPIDLVMRHTAPQVKLAFGSTLGDDPCEASWGVDDVALFVR